MSDLCSGLSSMLSHAHKNARFGEGPLLLKKMFMKTPSGATNALWEDLRKPIVLEKKMVMETKCFISCLKKRIRFKMCLSSQPYMCNHITPNMVRGFIDYLVRY